ncbi:histone methyltransferase [Amanita muscaria]
MKKERESPTPDPVTSSAQASSSSTPTLLTMSVKEEDSSSVPTPSTPTILPMDVDTMLEQQMSPSQSPTVADSTHERHTVSLGKHHTSRMTNGSKSETPTPPPPSLQPASSSGCLKKAAGVPVQLIGHLPVARDEALKAFVEISENNYQYKTLGRCKELLESMTCDCTYEHGIDNLKNACGSGSDCINRLTQVECLPDDCRCGSYCKNQRFQRREYADIQIISTEKKGYGLRAEKYLPKDAFVYEYVGDVVTNPSFKKRMRVYAEEGIEHFYFMMLQKDEFIDATKNGGIGRFANHSCNPNCYVAKWTIGDHVRMGIFAKRNIRMHEEITFNYNVDRYGHQAQPCYCGEPNCIGFIGGKTQTDIATIDDLYLDALGITDEADILELKGTKKKKGKKIDDPDFVPALKPIVEREVPKVVQAVRQTQSRKVLWKLLTRIRMTDDQAALRQIMRLRGYSVMTNLLEEHVDDRELVLLVLQCMSTWPIMNRNKVEDSRVIVHVQAFSELEENEDNTKIRTLAQQLINHWEGLPLYNRIPKRLTSVGEGDLIALTVISTTEDDERPCKRPRHIEREQFAEFKAKLAQSRQQTLDPFPPPPPLLPSLPQVPPSNLIFNRDSVQAIIEQAAAAEAAAAEAAAAEKQKAAESSTRKKTKTKKVLAAEEKGASKEKRLQKLIGAIVVKCMSKYGKGLERDQFKKYAKELTEVISQKERKSSTFKEGKLDSLSEEKTAKIKKFAKEYIAKIMRKVEKSKRDRPPASTASTAASGETPSLPNDTPQSGEGADASTSMQMSVEEAMDMEFDSESEAPDDHDDHDDREEHATATFVSTNDMQDISLSGLAEESPLDQLILPDVSNEPMDVKDHQSLATTDPRRRPQCC